MSVDSCPLSVVVLTHNEERNLSACLGSLRSLGCSLFVVDSGSTDRTVEIAKRFGATVVRHEFDTHARQWAWALSALPIATEWVLALDADQRLTPELAAELVQRFESDDGLRGIDGLYLPRRQVFRGRWIRHGGYYPKYLLKLFRRSRVQIDERDLVDHHFTVTGDAAKLGGDLVEENRNEDDIAFWIEKHVRYARLMAMEELRGERNGGERAHLLGTPDQRVMKQKRLWRRLPLFLRPLAYWIYRYFFRLGFLDGKEGFIFHFLHAFWFRLMVDVYLDELREEEAGK